jgi:hypothetical protein
VIRNFMKILAKMATPFHPKRPQPHNENNITGKYEILEGTEYSRFALPVDYPPSRDFRPRWGYSRPVEPVAQAWFETHRAEYRKVIDRMRVNANRLSDLSLKYDESLLPSPAWLDVPYSPFDGLALYTMIETYRPKRYLEVGSGITTCFAHRAITDNKIDCKIISVDPQPRAQINSICDEIIRDGLETCELEIFDRLEPNDILFIDGSHRSFMNSDVTVLMIDILPRLVPGVIVHLHDITIPYDYPLFFKNWYWNEQYILAVYLNGNRHRINPLFPTAFVCRDEALKDCFNAPFLELGDHNGGWLDGGAMWFTHTA